MQNKILKTVLAVLAILTAGVAIAYELSISVPVLSRDIKKGEVIKAEDISEMRFLKMTISDDVYEKGIDIVGKEAIYNLPSNVPVPYGSLINVVSEKDVEPSDKVVIAIAVESNRVPADIKVNDKVNIVTYFGEGTIKDTEAFVYGINVEAIVKNVRLDDSQKISGLDVAIDKKLSTKVMTSLALGNVYIIKNETDNDIEMEAITPVDIYNESFASRNVEVIIDESEVSE